MSGITNIGGVMCYASSAIQLLASSVILFEDFKDHKENHELQKGTFPIKIPFKINLKIIFFSNN